MREIEFRYIVKKPSGHIMIETFTLQDIEQGNVKSWFKNNIVGTNSEIYVSEFTGLLDKNKVKVFEGDIIQLIDLVYLVVFLVGDYRCGFYKKASNNLTDLGTEFINKFEVIGNIHQNPELLNENKPTAEAEKETPEA